MKKAASFTLKRYVPRKNVVTLKDLYELEKVKDIKTRDKILREATSSRDLVSRAQAAAAEAKRNENAKKLKEMLKKKALRLPRSQQKMKFGAENGILLRSMS